MPEGDMSFDHFGELVPEITPLNAPFWESLAAGEVRLQKCQGCGAYQYPPESFCYACGATGLVWEQVRGEGTVYSFIVVHQGYHQAFKAFLPYVVAVVQLDEGPRMLSAMLGLEHPIAIGDRVRPKILQVDAHTSFLSFEPSA